MRHVPVHSTTLNTTSSSVDAAAVGMRCTREPVDLPAAVCEAITEWDSALHIATPTI